MRIRICVTYAYEVPVAEYGDRPVPHIMAAEVADVATTLRQALDEGDAFVRVEVVSE